MRKNVGVAAFVKCHCPDPAFEIIKLKEDELDR